jgi:hypothetical protein
MRSALFWVLMQHIMEITSTCCIISQKSADLSVFLVVNNRFESTIINTKMNERLEIQGSHLQLNYRDTIVLKTV